MFKESKEKVKYKLDEIYQVYGSKLFGDCLENVRHVSDKILYQIYSDKSNEGLHGNSSGSIVFDNMLNQIYSDVSNEESFDYCLENVGLVSDNMLNQAYSDVSNKELRKTSSGCIARAVLYLAAKEVGNYCDEFRHPSYNDLANLKINNQKGCSKNKINDAANSAKGKIDLDKFSVNDLICLMLTD